MVWNKETRKRHDRRGQGRYPSDMTGGEWEVLEPLLAVAGKMGRPRAYDLREVMNGIRYVLRYGVPWDAMPRDLPPWHVCYDYWRRLSDGGHMTRINNALVMRDREKAGRDASPTLAIVDAQSVKCDAPQGSRGYDGGKQVTGRKRHLAVDYGGRLLAVAVTPASVSDQAGGIPLVQGLLKRWPWIEKVVVDAGYKATFIQAVKMAGDCVAEVVKRPRLAKGFHLLPKRWRVEQTIGVLTIPRRLKLDYETLLPVSASFILLASITRLLASLTS